MVTASMEAIADSRWLLTTYTAYAMKKLYRNRKAAKPHQEMN